MSLQLFNQYAYNSFDFTFQQRIKDLVSATRGALSISTDKKSGDIFQETAFTPIWDQVIDRDPDSRAAALEREIGEVLKNSIKYGWGTRNIAYRNTAFDWTARDPKIAGTFYGEQIAQGALANIINNAIGSLVASIQDDATYDGTASKANPESLNAAAGLFGDRRSSIACWLMHSKSQTDIFGYALQNANRLFDYAGVSVTTDGHNRPLIETDSDSLVFDNAGVNNYIQLGLVSGAFGAKLQGDTRNYAITSLEEENAKEILKTEGSYMLGIKGSSFKGAVKPTSLSLRTPANWQRVEGLGIKDTAGVKCITL